MLKTPARLEEQRATETTNVANASDETKLLSVERSDGAAVAGSSGVYVVERLEPAGNEASRGEGEHESETRRIRPMLLEHVTLVVYGWQNVQPGTLAWVFPSVGAAVSAARAMKNAVRWAIVAGKREADDDALDEARVAGAVLIEQAG